jgi:DNA-binding CsgD family transcriptional regulator
LSYKEIATILQINHRSVHMKKFRITEKLKAKGEAELEKIIQGIS